VSLYDGTKGHTVLTELVIPNGIASSPDGKYVYSTLFNISHFVKQSFITIPDMN